MSSNPEGKSAFGSKSSPRDSGRAEPEGYFLRYLSLTRTAVLVDAGFFLNRFRALHGNQRPADAARSLHAMALEHLRDRQSGARTARLYRIFVYDARPSEWKGHTPLSKQAVDYGQSRVAQWRRAFHEELRGMRKVALRLGELPDTQAKWQLNSQSLKELCNNKKRWDDISDDDFHLDLRQKGVDMRLGLDVAALALKQQINCIVLVSGDSDFVPAAKLARREGIDFVLDSMGANIRPELFEHIDGRRSIKPRLPQGRKDDSAQTEFEP